MLPWCHLGRFSTGTSLIEVSGQIFTSLFQNPWDFFVWVHLDSVQLTMLSPWLQLLGEGATLYFPSRLWSGTCSNSFQKYLPRFIIGMEFIKSNWLEQSSTYMRGFHYELFLNPAGDQGARRGDTEHEGRRKA